MKSLKYIVLILLVSLISCKIDMNGDKGKVVARVGEYYLYESDLQKLVREGMTVEDSIQMAESFINKWAAGKLMFIKAEENLSDERKNFERLIQDYRESLITNEYRQELIANNLDTIITKAEIEKFYLENKDNFLLNNDLVMLKYADFPVSINNKDEIILLMKSDSADDLKKLEALCYQYSYQFGISDSTWVSLRQLKKDMPKLRETDDNLLLKKGNFIEKQDSINLYLTRVIDVRNKSDLAPVSFVEDKIVNIILNKRKLNLFKSMEKQILKDAIANKEFETYE